MTHLLVHYHLRSGGVSSVIRSEIAAMQRLGVNVALLCAQPPDDLPCPAIALPELDYVAPSSLDAAELLEKVLAITACLQGPLIWHLHNPMLGCHPLWTEVVWRLAQRGERMIFHIHDFAEDGRMRNAGIISQEQHAYPTGARIRYVVLSRRDEEVLSSAGLSRGMCRVLANPVMKKNASEAPSGSPFILYPTRGIERKNLGELCLLAALAGNGVSFATTMHPGLSQHQPNYDVWRNVAREFNLPVRFGVVSDGVEDLNGWLQRATHVVSTSRQEGFGMVFIESIAWRRPLIGRAIPHVDADLRELYQIDHPWLYDAIHDGSGRDFTTFSPSEAVAAIDHSLRHPERWVIERSGEVFPAQSWLSGALMARTPLPIGLLESFSAEQHGWEISQLGASLLSAEEGVIGLLDKGKIADAFCLSR